MSDKPNPEMIILARESRGRSQGELAEAISVNRTTLLRYESGMIDVPPDRLKAIASFLGYPISFFYMAERVYGASCLYHRKRSSLSARQLKKIHAQVNILRMRAVILLDEAAIESDNRFHRLDLKQYSTPEKAAAALRHLWQLPSGPVRTVVGEIERAGGIVFRCPFGTAKVDAISQWPLDDPDTPPVFFVSEDIPGDRQRWTLCHEIGHVSLHHLPSTDPEGEADRFASEFLMPADEIRADLKGLTLDKAASLKSWWKVSMAALIKRAWFLGTITERQYRYLFTQLSAAGYRKCEPAPIRPEEPELFDAIVSVHKEAHGRNPRQLSEMLGMYETDFIAEYWKAVSGVKLVV